MKYLIVLSVLFLMSCKHESYCNKTFPIKDSSGIEVGFMLHGGILDAYDNGRIFISLVRINDPKDWDFNEYFTGDDFTPDESLEKKVLQSDSCELKQLYFEYLNNHK